MSDRVLVVDDDATLRRVYLRALERVGIEAIGVEDGLAALTALDTGPFAAVLTDITMPGLSGTDLLRAIRARDLDLPVILMTGAPTVETAIRAVELGALEYLEKPVELSRLCSVVRRAMQLSHLAQAKREALSMLGLEKSAGDLAGLQTVFARALETLFCAFQPIVRADGVLYGHEALMRSPDPALPNPMAVLDAAERLQRVDVLGRHMRRLVAQHFLDPSDTSTVFINLHPNDLVDPWLLADDCPVAPIASRVVLELTERAELSNADDVRRVVNALRERGYRLAIDDLGAGYAGLTWFAVLEPEVVKLDMSLIRGIDSSAIKQKVVRSMTLLCRDLGMFVVAEGVETQAEFDFVRAVGCDAIQGYLLARPGPPFPAIRWPASLN